jgi:hypothetical protein
VIYEQSLHRRRAGTADIVLPLLFPAEKTSLTALLARQLFLLLFWSRCMTFISEAHSPSS